MAHSYRARTRVHADADAILQRMLDPAEQEATARRFGAVEVHSEARDLGDGRIRIELTTAEPDRKRGGTVRATLELAWDTRARECRWTRRDLKYGDRVRASGSLRLLPAGDDACDVDEDGSFEVRVPVIGKRIAAKLAAAMERRAGEKARYWAERARGG